MRYFLIFFITLHSLAVFSQSTAELYVRLATKSGIKQPVPQRFASLVLKHPIQMDSLSLAHFHHTYITRMIAGTTLLATGTVIMVSHIFAAAFIHNFNRDAVIVAAAIGVSSMTAGSIVLPFGASERHRYKKSLRIVLAGKGL
jgi:hypothetical protein